MVLTDYEDKVLRNLRECMAMNAAEVNHLSHNGNHACGVGGPEEALEGDEDEDDMFGDPEDAEECDDFDFFSGAAGAGRQPPGSQQPWDYVSTLCQMIAAPCHVGLGPAARCCRTWHAPAEVLRAALTGWPACIVAGRRCAPACMHGCMTRCCMQGKVCVRYMDWNDELHRLHRAASQPGAAAGGGKGASDREDGAAPAALDAHATFDVVLGSDILYEVSTHQPGLCHLLVLAMDSIVCPSLQMIAASYSAACKRTPTNYTSFLLGGGLALPGSVFVIEMLTGCITRRWSMRRWWRPC